MTTTEQSSEKYTVMQIRLYAEEYDEKHTSEMQVEECDTLEEVYNKFTKIIEYDTSDEVYNKFSSIFKIDKSVTIERMDYGYNYVYKFEFDLELFNSFSINDKLSLLIGILNAVDPGCIKIFNNKFVHNHIKHDRHDCHSDSFIVTSLTDFNFKDFSSLITPQLNNPVFID